MDSIVGSRLRALRANTVESQRDLGDLIGVSRQTYGAYETGAIQPPMGKLVALADHYGVSVDYITGKSDSMHRVDIGLSDVSVRLQAALDDLRGQSGMPDPLLSALIHTLDTCVNLAKLLAAREEELP